MPGTSRTEQSIRASSLVANSPPPVPKVRSSLTRGKGLPPEGPVAGGTFGAPARPAGRSQWRASRLAEGGAAIGKVGDWLIVESVHVGGEPRKGQILEVLSSESGNPRYRVRWMDEHESLFVPTLGSARIVPAEEHSTA